MYIHYMTYGEANINTTQVTKCGPPLHVDGFYGHVQVYGKYRDLDLQNVAFLNRWLLYTGGIQNMYYCSVIATHPTSH